jgi:hypothetical protein
VLGKEIGNPAFIEPPTAYQIKLFVRLLAASRTGILEDTITTTTAQNRLACLKQAVKLHTNYEFNHIQNAELGHSLLNH